MGVRRPTRRAAALGAIGPLLWVACAHLVPGTGRLAECPGALRATQEIPEDLRLDQRMRIRAKRIDVSMRIVVEKRGGRLVVIGLDPLGAVLFSVVQTGVEVEIEALPRAVAPVPPLNVLRDLHRVRFLSADVPPDASGRAESERDGTRITEEWIGGALRLRRFARVRGAPRGEIVVAFGAAPSGGIARARIENGWCGYTAQIDTFVEESLP